MSRQNKTWISLDIALTSPRPLWFLFPTKQQDLHNPHREPALFQAKWIPLKPDSMWRAGSCQPRSEGSPVFVTLVSGGYSIIEGGGGRAGGRRGSCSAGQWKYKHNLRIMDWTHSSLCRKVAHQINTSAGSLNYRWVNYSAYFQLLKGNCSQAHLRK